MHLMNDKLWWLMEKKDINRNPWAMQLNAVFKK
jgi:hypothetical protein